MKKSTIRILSALLSVMLLLPLAACGKEPAADGTDTTAAPAQSTEPTTTAVPETTAPVDKNGFLLDDIPADLNYNGATVNILADDGQKKQYYAVDLTGDIVNDALYNREATVEERLGVKLEWIFEKGAYDGRAKFAQIVENSYNAGTQDYDLVVAYNLTPPMMAVKGVVENLGELEHIHLDRPWWPTGYVEQALYKNKLYCIAESSSRGVLRNMMAIFYNKDLAEQYGMNDDQLLGLVLDGKWTLDKLAELAKGTYRDLNGNNQADADDQYGFSVATKASMDGLYFGSGLSITQLDEAGTPVFTLGDERVQSYLDKILPILYGNPDAYALDAKQYQMFLGGRAVFYECAVAVTDKLRDVELRYGVLPLPKFDEAQEKYCTSLANTHDVWAIPAGGKDAQRSGAILECLASEAYRQIYPAYYETALKVKYAPDDKIAQVYDMMRDAATFDFGHIYSTCFSRMPALYVRDCVLNNNNGWSAVWAAQKEPMEKQLVEILDALAKN